MWGGGRGEDRSREGSGEGGGKWRRGWGICTPEEGTVDGETAGSMEIWSPTELVVWAKLPVDIAQFTYHNNCAGHVVRQEERQEAVRMDCRIHHTNRQ